MTKQGEDWWNEERVAELKARWNGGQTGTEICRAMGATSRNAVLGKAWRLGLRPRVKFTQLARNPTKRMRKRLKPPKTAPGSVHYIDGRVFTIKGEAMPEPLAPLLRKPKTLMQLRHDSCRWPGEGHGADMLYCGAPAERGYPYCAEHCEKAYSPLARTPRQPRRV